MLFLSLDFPIGSEMRRSIASTLERLQILYPLNCQADGSKPMRVGAPRFLDASGWSSEIQMTAMIQLATSTATGPLIMRGGTHLTKATSLGPTKFPVQVTEK